MLKGGGFTVMGWIYVPPNTGRTRSRVGIQGPMTILSTTLTAGVDASPLQLRLGLDELGARFQTENVHRTLILCRCFGSPLAGWSYAQWYSVTIYQSPCSIPMP